MDCNKCFDWMKFDQLNNADNLSLNDHSHYYYCYRCSPQVFEFWLEGKFEYFQWDLLQFGLVIFHELFDVPFDCFSTSPGRILIVHPGKCFDFLSANFQSEANESCNFQNVLSCHSVKTVVFLGDNVDEKSVASGSGCFRCSLIRSVDCGEAFECTFWIDRDKLDENYYHSHHLNSQGSGHWKTAEIARIPRVIL